MQAARRVCRKTWLLHTSHQKGQSLFLHIPETSTHRCDEEDGQGDRYSEPKDASARTVTHQLSPQAPRTLIFEKGQRCDNLRLAKNITGARKQLKPVQWTFSYAFYAMRNACMQAAAICHDACAHRMTRPNPTDSIKNEKGKDPHTTSRAANTHYMHP